MIKNIVVQLHINIDTKSKMNFEFSDRIKVVFEIPKSNFQYP